MAVGVAYELTVIFFVATSIPPFSTAYAERTVYRAHDIWNLDLHIL